MVSKARLDLPEPDRPVITVRLSRAMSTLTPLRLCSRAPRTEIWVSIGRALFRLCSSLARGDAAGQRRFSNMGAVVGIASAAAQIIRQKGGGLLPEQTSGLVWVVRQYFTKPRRWRMAGI